MERGEVSGGCRVWWREETRRVLLKVQLGREEDGRGLDGEQHSTHQPFARRD